MLYAVTIRTFVMSSKELFSFSTCRCFMPYKDVGVDDHRSNAMSLDMKRSVKKNRKAKGKRGRLATVFEEKLATVIERLLSDQMQGAPNQEADSCKLVGVDSETKPSRHMNDNISLDAMMNNLDELEASLPRDINQLLSRTAGPQQDMMNSDNVPISSRKSPPELLPGVQFNHKSTSEPIKNDLRAADLIIQAAEATCQSREAAEAAKQPTVFTDAPYPPLGPCPTTINYNITKNDHSTSKEIINELGAAAAEASPSAIININITNNTTNTTSNSTNVTNNTSNTNQVANINNTLNLVANVTNNTSNTNQVANINNTLNQVANVNKNSNALIQNSSNTNNISNNVSNEKRNYLQINNANVNQKELNLNQIVQHSSSGTARPTDLDSALVPTSPAFHMGSRNSEIVPASTTPNSPRGRKFKKRTDILSMRKAGHERLVRLRDGLAKEKRNSIISKHRPA